MEHPSNFVDLTGKKFNSWTVEGLAYTKDWRLYWNCQCDCGNRKVMRGDSLQNIKVPYCSQCKPRNTVLRMTDLPYSIVTKVKNREAGLFHNTFVVDGELVYAYTSNSECFLFDSADIEKAKQHTWTRKHLRDGWYVYTTVKGKFTYFHTVILENLDCEKAVDHINRDKLDNRRSNLRFCCQQQNAFNQGLMKTNTLGFKGIRKHASGKWNATIMFCQRSISLGLYMTKEEAAAVYDVAAELLFDEFAFFNCSYFEDMPVASDTQRAYVVYRCLKRLSDWEWKNNPELLAKAIERLEAEKKRIQKKAA